MGLNTLVWKVKPDNTYVIALDLVGTGGDYAPIQVLEPSHKQIAEWRHTIRIIMPDVEYLKIFVFTFQRRMSKMMVIKHLLVC